MILLDRLYEAYKELNKNFERNVIYYVGLKHGFFSEFNMLIVAMAYCLKHRIRLEVCADEANFDNVNGWYGFFKEPPFVMVHSDKRLHYRSENWMAGIKRFLLDRDYKLVEIQRIINSYFTHPQYTQDIFGKMRNKVTYRFEKYNISQLGLKGDLQEICRDLVSITWCFNQKTESEILDIIQNLSLPRRYISMHIRCGDKIQEHKNEKISKYFAMIKCKDIRDVYVATDDYSMIEYIKEKYPQYNIYTLEKKTQRGYYQGNFDKMCSNEKRIKLIPFFASIEIINKSEQFIGTFSSNIGMFVGMRNPQIMTGVDYKKWLLW